MKKIFFYIACLGWILGFTVHLLTYWNIDISEKIPFVWFLHVGIFLLWIPAIIFSSMNKNNSKKEEIKDPSDFVPKWMLLIAQIGYIYGIINFVIFIFTQDGEASIVCGNYELWNKGKFVKALTEQEYDYYKANLVKGFSGHWILFYGYAAVYLYPFNKSINEDLYNVKN